ncbi:MAG TPA: hypothetical protein DEB31_08575 [Clostridiales bacterium]|nr:hypothetical protein [Clostridiales bacterium]
MENRRTFSGDTFKLIVNIVLLVFGLILIARPTEAMQGIVIVLGVILLVVGGVMMAVHIVKRQRGSEAGSLTAPVIGVILGIILLIFNGFFANILLPLVIGIWILIVGIMNLYASTALKHAGGSFWKVSTVLALAAVALGIIMLIGVFAGGNVVGVLLGVCMLLFGIISIVHWAMLRDRR